MRNDSDIEEDVISELKWEARVDHKNIEVKVQDGRVTLRGKVKSYPAKLEAERCVTQITGVKTVFNELEVIIPDNDRKADAEIEQAVRNLLKWNSNIDKHKLEVEVRDGWVTLTGKVDWEYQRARARSLAEEVSGVKGVANLIQVGAGTTTKTDIREKIKLAMKRNHYLSRNNINIQIDNSKAILKGKVRTLADRSVAESAAWSAPGITEVQNELEVEHDESYA